MGRYKTTLPFFAIRDTMPEFIIELEHCIPALRRYAFTLFHKQDEADDLVQDCLERALQKQDLWQKESSLRAWLFTMQHNIFINQLKSKARKPELVSSTETLTDIIEPNQPNVTMRDIHYCMQQLPEDQREVLLLVTVEGFSYKEVGKIVDIPLGTVMSRLSRARKALQKLMNGEVKTVLREVR